MSAVPSLGPSGGWRSPCRLPSGASGRQELLHLMDTVCFTRARLQVSGLEAVEGRVASETFGDSGGPPVAGESET